VRGECNLWTSYHSRYRGTFNPHVRGECNSLGVTEIAAITAFNPHVRGECNTQGYGTFFLCISLSTPTCVGNVTVLISIIRKGDELSTPTCVGNVTRRKALWQKG